MLTLVWQADPAMMLESEWILRVIEMSGVAYEQVIDLHHQWIGPGAIVVTRGEPCDGISTHDYLRRFRDAGLSVGAIHVGDEFSQQPVDFYEAAAFVWRQTERPGVADRPNVRWFPLGFKKGLVQHLEPQPIAQRKLLWSFAGFVPGRLSRRSMVHHARRIPGGAMELGKAFNDSSSLSFDNYVRMLCDTKYCLAPGGNRHVESYRVYEAMMAGAVPVVEVLTVRKLLLKVIKDVFSRERSHTYTPWTWCYWQEIFWWLRHRDLWTEQFGPDFPCPKVKSWRDLPRVLDHTQLETLAQRVQQFWTDYQQRMGARLAADIATHLAIEAPHEHLRRREPARAESKRSAA